MLKKILQRQQVANSFKETLTNWRSRGVDWWHETEKISRNVHAKKSLTNSKECEDNLDYNEISRLDTSELSRLVSHLAMGPSSKIKDTKSDFESKLSLFQNNSDKEIKISRNKNNSIFIDRNEHTYDDVKEAMKMIGSYKANKNNEETVDFEGSNAWDSLNVSNVENKVDNEGKLLKLTNDQKNYIKHAEKDFSSGSQVLHLIHGGAGVGKSFLINAVQEAIKSNNKIAVIACPTGSAATMLDGGQTFHHVFMVFKYKGESNMQSVIGKMRKENFSDNVDLIIIDEVSMMSAEFLVLLDSRLRLLYDERKPFGGKNVILSGDYLQMACTFGTPLCSALYLTTNSDKTEARNLFSLFKVFHVNDQVRATCEKQKRCLEKFRTLPNFYPSTKYWTRAEKKKYKVIDDEICETLTREINFEDMTSNGKWKIAPIVTTNNEDRLALNNLRIRQFAIETKQILVTWRKKSTNKNIPLSALNKLHEDNPELIGYFCEGAPAVVNSN